MAELLVRIRTVCGLFKLGAMIVVCQVDCTGSAGVRLGFVLDIDHVKVKQLILEPHIKVQKSSAQAPSSVQW